MTTLLDFRFKADPHRHLTSFIDSINVSAQQLHLSLDTHARGAAGTPSFTSVGLLLIDTVASPAEVNAKYTEENRPINRRGNQIPPPMEPVLEFPADSTSVQVAMIKANYDVTTASVLAITASILCLLNLVISHLPDQQKGRYLARPDARRTIVSVKADLRAIYGIQRIETSAAIKADIAAPFDPNSDIAEDLIAMDMHVRTLSVVQQARFTPTHMCDLALAKLSGEPEVHLHLSDAINAEFPIPDNRTWTRVQELLINLVPGKRRTTLAMGTQLNAFAAATAAVPTLYTQEQVSAQIEAAVFAALSQFAAPPVAGAPAGLWCSFHESSTHNTSSCHAKAKADRAKADAARSRSGPQYGRRK